MLLEPHDFAYDYLMRTGIMTPERLHRSSPAFMAAYQKMKAVDRLAI